MNRETENILRIALSKNGYSSLSQYISLLKTIPNIETDDVLNSIVSQITSGKPIEYIVGLAEFKGNLFNVDSRVLIPRIETEGIVDLVVSHKSNITGVIEIGVGSGALITTISTQTGLDCIGTDISQDALDVADTNIKRYKQNIPLYLSDLLQNDVVVSKINKWKQYILVANLPYISKEKDSVQSSVAMYEPELALYSNDMGTEHIKILLKQISELTHRPTYVVLECDPWQIDDISSYITKYLREYAIEVVKDCYNQDRFITLLLPTQP